MPDMGRREFILTVGGATAWPLAGRAQQALKLHTTGLLVPGTPSSHRPTLYSYREGVEAGGLMSYGPNMQNMWRRGAEFVDKILRGAKPGDLPVEQRTKFALVVNMITAQALALEVPPSLLARADEVIE
jgi:putative tryptophan/tyrosine transport system substrate-binding protein